MCEDKRCAACGLPLLLSAHVTTRKGATWHVDCMLAFSNSLRADAARLLKGETPKR